MGLFTLRKLQELRRLCRSRAYPALSREASGASDGPGLLVSPGPSLAPLAHQSAELLVVGLAGAQRGDLVQPPYLVQAHHAVEAFLQQQGVGVAQAERLSREQDNAAAALVLDAL